MVLARTVEATGQAGAEISQHESGAQRDEETTTFMRRMGLRHTSVKKARWDKRYSAEKGKRIRAGEVCARCHTKCGILDGHHILNSKANEKVLCFVIMGRMCHDWITSKPNLAREDGWMAEINGSFSKDQPAVVRARARWEELVKELETL